MNDITLNLLMATLAKKCEEYDDAKKFAFMVVSSRSAPQKTKDKARQIIDDIKTI